jgi:hypothetical protein
MVIFNVLHFAGFKGFVIVGVMPDANGTGKPDMLMDKSVMR